MATDSIPDYATHEDIGRLEGHIQATREDVSRLEGSVQTLEGTVQATRKDVSRLEGSVQALDGTVQATREVVSRLEHRFEDRLDRLDHRLWLFMGTILVFTLGIVAKEAL